MPDWVLQVAGAAVAQVFVAGAIYGGIKAGIEHAIACAQEAKGIGNRAHDRIDNLLAKG